MHSVRLISRTRPSACIVLHARRRTAKPLTVDAHVFLFIDTHYHVVLFSSHGFTQRWWVSFIAMFITDNDY